MKDSERRRTSAYIGDLFARVHLPADQAYQEVEARRRARSSAHTPLTQPRVPLQPDTLVTVTEDKRARLARAKEHFRDTLFSIARSRGINDAHLARIAEVTRPAINQMRRMGYVFSLPAFGSFLARMELTEEERDKIVEAYAQVRENRFPTGGRPRVMHRETEINKKNAVRAKSGENTKKSKKLQPNTEAHQHIRSLLSQIPEEKIISTLTNVELLFVGLHYGLGGIEPRTITSITDKHASSPVEVKKIIDQALKKIVAAISPPIDGK